MSEKELWDVHHGICHALGRFEAEILDAHNDIVAYVYEAKHARLIAAAPELLDACEKVLDLFDTGPVTATEVNARRGGVYDTIRAAIAKAKGDGDDLS